MKQIFYVYTLPHPFLSKKYNYVTVKSFKLTSQLKHSTLCIDSSRYLSKQP